MNNLEALKQAKAVMDGYAKAKKDLDDFINSKEDKTLVLAAVVEYMKVFGKENPEGMKEVKELSSLLEK